MKKSKYMLNFLIIFLLTIGVLWFALKDNYREVLEAISQINIFSLAIILCWGILYTVVWGFVYFVLGRKYVHKYSVGKGILVAFVGTFFAGITPSSTGGQFAQAYIMNKQGMKVSDAASLLWADFIIYQTTMMIYVTILFLLRFGYYSAQSAWFNVILLGYAVNAIVILALYTMALFPKVYIRLAGFFARLLNNASAGESVRKTAHLKESGKDKRFLESADDFLHKGNQESFYGYQTYHPLCFDQYRTIDFVILFTICYWVGPSYSIGIFFSAGCDRFKQLCHHGQ